MKECDLCGRKTEVINAIVERSVVSVCHSCAKYGIILDREEPKVENPKKNIFIKKEEILDLITPDCKTIVKKEREKLNLKQEELARLIGEKESVIQKIESGHIEPSIETARKLEQFLKIKLVEQHKEEVVKKELNFKDSKITISDLIKMKKDE